MDIFKSGAGLSGIGPTANVLAPGMTEVVVVAVARSSSSSSNDNYNNNYNNNKT